MGNNDVKKIFISYSWTSSEHEQKVLDLATELMESGVDVVLDKWDLKEGDDADKFMERMVSDPTISKVLIISDKAYVEKANKRKGGAGTEAQIISKEIYEQQDENKFVVAVFEFDENSGKPYIPIYYGSRKYIDFTDQSKYSVKFEELVRWIYNKPLYKKPELGKKPSYILEEEKKTLGTTSSFKRCISLYKELKPNRKAALHEYLEKFIDNLERFRIVFDTNNLYDELFYNNITDFLPYRNEWIELLEVICNNNFTDNEHDLFHSFFENLHLYTLEKIGYTYYSNQIEENFKFIEHELFIYYITILIKYNLYTYVYSALSSIYYNKKAQDPISVKYNFRKFYNYIHCLEKRNQRLNLNRISLHADLLKERAKTITNIPFDDLIQADLIIFLYNIIHTDNDYLMWCPITLIYASERRVPFELFVRAESKSFFCYIKKMLNINNKQDLIKASNDIKNRRSLYSYRWEYNLMLIDLFLNLSRIDTI